VKSVRRQSSARPPPSRELAKLRARLAEAQETLRAIRRGEVDAVIVAGREGPQVFSLQGAEHAYRVLIESMNEGALTLTAGNVILYANRRFAKMVKCPLEHVTGSSLGRFLSAEDQATLGSLMKRADKRGSIQVLLKAADGSPMPAQISIRLLPRNGFNRVIFGMVVTDMTEVRRTEGLLRTLSDRLVQAQEVERGHVALRLHDHITQLLCAILVRCQALAVKLAVRDGPSRAEAIKLREMLGKAAEEVERISRDLRPSVLDELGLPAALRGICADFADRTNVSLKLADVPFAARLPAEVELALFRIAEKALQNVEQHARARHVTVGLEQPPGFVLLTIKDDGIGFNPNQRPATGNEMGGIGLHRMRQRATYVGGTLKVKSSRRAGTEITVRVTLPPNGRHNGASLTT